MSATPASIAASLDLQTREAYRRAIRRVPTTMQPGLNQKLNQWDSLFPFERKQLVDFLRGLDQFSSAQFDELVHPLLTLEVKMGVEHWNFSTEADTVENASLLARSPYYADWRHEVDRIFAAIEDAAHNSEPKAKSPGRVVLLVLPRSLPITTIAAKKPWDTRGVEVQLDGDPAKLCELAMSGTDGLPAALTAQHESTVQADSADCWLIDAEASLSKLLPSPRPPASLLEYTVLAGFRDRFLARVNTIPKDIHGADQVLAEVRSEDWSALWPASLAGEDRLRSFMVDLFFSGNGALIFSNAFVEWAASEAIRRARPRVMVCRFGMRSKPKPFTGIAIFENQKTISMLRDEDDPQGSAVDALILARYIWLSAARHPEGAQTAFVCVSEASRTAYVIPPEGRSLAWTAAERVTPEALAGWMRNCLLT